MTRSQVGDCPPQEFRTGMASLGEDSSAGFPYAEAGGGGGGL